MVGSAIAYDTLIDVTATCRGQPRKTDHMLSHSPLLRFLFVRRGGEPPCRRQGSSLLHCIGTRMVLITSASSSGVRHPRRSDYGKSHTRKARWPNKDLGPGSRRTRDTWPAAISRCGRCSDVGCVLESAHQQAPVQTLTRSVLGFLFRLRRTSWGAAGAEDRPVRSRPPFPIPPLRKISTGIQERTNLDQPR